VLEVQVSDHSVTKRHTNKRNSDQEVAEHPQEECTPGQWWGGCDVSYIGIGFEA
jgi:hypothetical protein